jgi:hypothetical protein
MNTKLLSITHPNEKLFGKIADILAVEIATKSKGRKIKP